MAEIDLLLKSIFLPELADDDELPDSLYTDVNRVADASVHPVEKFFEATADQISKVSADDWNEELGGAVFEKRGKPTYKTIADLLGIVRTENKLIDGEMWVQAYNAANEMVDARILCD